MFHPARLVAALGLALAAFGTAVLPASAQGTVREHRGRDTPPAPAPGARDHRTVKPPPPAPKPGVRDHRTTADPAAMTPTVAPDEPRQWSIRNAGSVNPGQEYTIINLRRQLLDKASRLTFEESPSGLADGTGWGDNGGNWILTRSNVGASGALTDNETVAVYNTRTRRYLYMDRPLFPIWKDKPQYVWQVKHAKQTADGVDFALYSLQQKRYVGLCHPSLAQTSQAAADNELCAHPTPKGWKP